MAITLVGDNDQDVPQSACGQSLMACFSGLVWRPVTLGLIDDTLTFLGMISETHPEIVNISLGLTLSFIVD